jgi:hypothetical protein
MFEEVIVSIEPNLAEVEDVKVFVVLTDEVNDSIEVNLPSCEPVAVCILVTTCEMDELNIWISTPLTVPITPFVTIKLPVTLNEPDIEGLYCSIYFFRFVFYKYRIIPNFEFLRSKF